MCIYIHAYIPSTSNNLYLHLSLYLYLHLSLHTFIPTHIYLYLHHLYQYLCWHLLWNLYQYYMHIHHTYQYIYTELLWIIYPSRLAACLPGVCVGGGGFNRLWHSRKSRCGPPNRQQSVTLHTSSTHMYDRNHKSKEYVLYIKNHTSNTTYCHHMTCSKNQRQTVLFQFHRWVQTLPRCYPPWRRLRDPSLGAAVWSREAFGFWFINFNF